MIGHMAGDGSARPTARTLALLVPVAVLVTIALAWLDDSRMVLGQDVLVYGYGVPVDWLMQDVPFDIKDELAARDPREAHTTVAWGALAANLALVYVLLVAAAMCVRRVLRPTLRPVE